MLNTKLFIPPIRKERVPRPRLVELMNSGLEKALILVSAPAGYGKTTLVSGWLNETNITSAWLSLDEGDNDPVYFSQYLINALHLVVPAIQLDLLNVAQGMQTAPYEAMVNILINEIAEQPSPLLLVLDDFHTIRDQPVLDICSYLIEHIPPQLHLALITRTDPPIPLSRLRVRNQLVDIRAEQLRFTQAEIACFLNDLLNLRLSSEDIAALEARTEGWIASIQLAACSMQGVEDVHHFISAFTGSNYYVMDYLAEEVMAQQTEAVRTFLVQTSILERMCAALCNAVINLDGDGQTDAQRMLETLALNNLFLISLDDKRQWFRYHHLFADVLKQRVEHIYPGKLPELHHRASVWLEQNGLIYDAIHHALEGKDKERAARLVDRYGCELLIRGEVINLLSWIKAVEPFSQSLPWVAIQKGWSLALTGQFDQVEAPLQTAEQLIKTLEPSDDTATMSGTVQTARAFRANMLGKPGEAAIIARQALDGLPESNDFSCSLRSVATSILGDASRMNGNLVDAQRAYEDAVQISQHANSLHMFITANTNLAEILVEQGQIIKAAKKFKETLQAATLPDGQISALAEQVYAGMSAVSYEMNHLEESAGYARQCIDQSRRWGNIDCLATSHILVARLEHARGNRQKAQQAMRAAEKLLSEYTFSHGRGTWIKTALARLWIAQGNPERAALLVQKSAIAIDSKPGEADISYLQEPIYLILLRLYLTEGEYDKAIELSESLTPKLEASGQVGKVIESLALRALAFQGKKDIDQALTVLEKAFTLAQPEGYTRTFLDEGEPMVKLLFQAKSHRVFSEYAAELLAAELLAGDITQASGENAGARPAIAQPLIEPLTAREIEVLQLIESGCSNQDIANKLVISITTVKRHISNIYAKLGVESRTQAVSIGKELSLLR